MFSATIVSIASGVNIAWPSPSIPYILREDYHHNVTIEEGSYIAIIAAFGNVVGSPISSVLVEIIGRKYAIVLIAFPQLSSFLLIYFSYVNLWFLYLARFLGGLSEGATFTIMAIYIGEISEPRVRGTLGSFLSLTLRIGMLLINIIGSYMTMENAALVCLAFPITFLITFIWMPESPYYLLMRNRYKEAEISLKYLRQNDDVQEELIKMNNDVQRQLSETGTFMDLIRINSNRRACIVIMGLRTIQQFSGISAFTLYTQLLFKGAVEDIQPSTAAIIFSSIQLVLTLISSFIVDKTGRKPLLIFSCISCCIILVVEGTFSALKDNDVDLTGIKWIPMTGLILFIILFSVGLGSIVNLMLGELFSASVKAKALCLVNIYFAICYGLTSKFFQFMADWRGLTIPFFVFSFCSGMGAIFCYYFVPETKGKTLEEIQQSLKKMM